MTTTNSGEIGADTSFADEEEERNEMTNGEAKAATGSGGKIVQYGEKNAINGDGADEEEEKESKIVNGDEMVEDRTIGTTTPPASERRQTPPLSANIRAPTVRKRCSAVFSAQTSHSSSTSSGGGGLSALTSAMLGKKPRKQSVLDNAASGWRSFVQEEQLEQELESHMRSKDAYLDKQEFLLRADYSQFERERDLRAQERRVQQQQQSNSNKPR